MHEQVKQVAAEEAVIYKKRKQLPDIWHRFRKNKRAVCGLVIMIIIVLAGIFAPVICQYDPIQQNLREAYQTPSLAHWFGTDSIGRDLFTRVVYGIRTSLLCGVIAVAISLVIGGVLGAVAGYYGGKVDNIIMRFMDILLAIPSLLLAISMVAALGGGMVNMLFAIGISSMPTYCRTLRGEILKIRKTDFVEAAKAAGAKDSWIIVKHIIPNCLAPIIVRVTMGVASAILFCASLSFIGLGVSPPTPEWGQMLSFGRDFIRTYPHMSTFPGLAIMVTVFSLNMMGDGLRDALDPKMKT
ncbi:MAG: ABC transporter permease [Candidatus Avoscillospira sp.]